MKGTFAPAFLAIFTAFGIAVDAAAQELPALQGAAPEEKARILQLVEDAKKEGSLTYWDVVIQPETNDKLSAQFREYYGLPASTSSPARQPGDRVEQEIGADRVTHRRRWVAHLRARHQGRRVGVRFAAIQALRQHLRARNG